jgi:heme-degrading monooxygenase HmoA
MHIQIVNFNLKDISEEDYRGLCESIAPIFANLSGLVSKTWLADSTTNTYGSIYVWQDREAMEYYEETDIFKGIETNPHFEGITVKDFAVLDSPTRITGGSASFAA